MVKAKDGTGSATLSMAQAGARFASSLIRAMSGEAGVVEPAYVASPAVVPGLEFFSTRISLGPAGVAAIHPIGAMSPYEEKLLEAAVPQLEKNIADGVEFVKKSA